MRMSLMRLARRLRSEPSSHGLSLTQVATLATLDLHGPLTPRELAVREQVQPPSMTRILAGLEERDLVTRTRHAGDGRRHVIALTEVATDLLREDRLRHDAWLALRLAELTEGEADVLRAAGSLLDRLTAHEAGVPGAAQA